MKAYDNRREVWSYLISNGSLDHGDPNMGDHPY